MPYDERLADRVRNIVRARRGVLEKTMFGGLGFLLNGHMSVGIWRDALVVRVGPAQYETALREPGAREFDITGRPMTGWVLVGRTALSEDSDLEAWVQAGLQFARSLPTKSVDRPR
jgi:TfoX/Sxy family transcriptional regulator of competence genes